MSTVAITNDRFEIVAPVASALTENLDAARDAYRRAAQPYPHLPFYRRVIEGPS